MLTGGNLNSETMIETLDSHRKTIADVCAALAGPSPHIVSAKGLRRIDL